jgi:DNA-directed RNA polymerase specialized sigma24 family protein
MSIGIANDGRAECRVHNLTDGAAEFEFCASEASQPDFLCEQRDTLEHLSKYLSKNASRENVVVLELREVQGYTYSEIAQWLNIPVGTVKSRLSRVRAVAKRFAKEYA